MVNNVCTPLVSVVIPTYGRIDFLEEAIQSVMNQTYKNVEIIVCDDNSQLPNVRQNVKEIVSKYPTCKLVENKKNLGGALNRNEGIKVSKGELISFLDDDDVYLPTRIEKVVELYLQNKQKKVGIIYTYCQFTDENLNVRGEYCTEPSNNPLYKHMCGCLCATSQWVIPKYVFDEVGMFEQTPCKQDSIMLLKVLGKFNCALCVPEHLSLFRDHSGPRISENFQKHLEGENNYAIFLRQYYGLLTNPQVKHVEACIAKRMLYNYSGLRDKANILKCLEIIVHNDGITGLSMYDLLYVFASPQTYKKMYHLFKKSIEKLTKYI